MADTQNKSVQYQEALFEAMKIVSQKQVESVSFDKTIEAVVTDASRAAEGIYQVSTGSSQFIAYSTETGYKQNDAVMVTIPQGNFDKQKMIIGKQVDDTDSPLIYKSPFQQFVNISNNLIYGSADLGTFPYYANGDDNSILGKILGKKWDIDEPDFGKSNACQIIDINTDNRAYGQIWESPPAFFEQGFTRLGLSAQFSTWLDEYDVISGNYGLALKVTFKCVDLEEENNTFDKYFIFDSSEFFGNVYNFETFYMQEKLFNIEDFIDYPIIHIVLYAYQRGNFKTISGDVLSYGDYGGLPEGDNFDFSIIQPNIFVKSPMVCLGIPVEDFESDTAEIFCDSGLTYHKQQDVVYKPIILQSDFNSTEHVYNASGIEIDKGDWDENTYYKQTLEEIDERNFANQKNIQLRWVRKDSKTDTIATVEEDAIPEGYEIRWYRYSVGAQSPDEFAGAHWQRFYGCKSIPDDTGDWCITEEENNFNEDIDAATNSLLIEFQPNVNRQEEKLKVIILKNEGTNQNPRIYRLIAKSNIITLTNNDEVRNQATIIDMNELAIRFNDDEKGQYFIYNRAGKVKSGQSTDIRTLTAVFEPNEYNVEIKAELTECSSIKWTFPTSNTMIIPMTNDEMPVEVPPEQASDHFTKTGQDVDTLFTVRYRIKENLDFTYSNNTVKLEINKDGAVYTASVQMLFGTAGTSGSDYTLLIEWEVDKSNPNKIAVIDLGDNSTRKLVGNIVLKDQARQRIEIPATATIEADWYVAEYGSSTSKSKELETNDIYYPVFKNESQTLNNGGARLNGSTNPDNGYQDGYYYYFIDQSAKENCQYYTFDPEGQQFIATEYDSNNVLYRKVQQDENNKNKLEFREVTFEKDIFDQETGDLNPDYSEKNSIEIVDEDDEYSKKYYYNNDQKFFIKCNGVYVIDPWSTYQEGEFYYEPLEAKEVKYNTPNDYITIDTNVDSTVKKVTLTADNNVTMNSIWVLRITLKNFGDYPLVALFPIALKKSPAVNGRIDGINGPTFVRYSCDGETDFDKNPYSLNTTNLSIPNKMWRIICPDDQHNIVPVSDIAKDNFLPSLEVSGSNTSDVLLSPPSIYIPQYRPYAVQCFTHDNNEDNIYWTQSILVYEDNYPSTTLNKWNGKEIVTDENAGTITANGFSAGKKERDNKFTGVVIGDWSRSDIDAAVAKNTGIYGFNHGSMSYAFKDDGTGFIGKDGKGRIYLNGDKSQIFSSKWVNRDDPQGMLLDIDDGYIKMQSPKKENQSWDQNSHDSYQQEQVVTRYSNVETLSDRVLERWKFLAQQSDQSQLEKVRDILRGYSYATATDANTANFASYYTYSSGVGYTSAAGTTFSNTATYFTQNNAYITATAVYMNFTGATAAYTAVFAQQQVQYNLFSDNDNNINRWLYTPKNNSTQNFITIDATAGTYPLAIGDNKNIINRGFRVKWDGTTYINNGEFSGLINAKGGSISGDLDVVGTLNGGILNADELNVYYGEIGGWTISRTELSGGGTTLSTVNGITTNKGKIGGWILSENGLTGGNTTLHKTNGITTNNIKILDSPVSGSIGAVTGNNGVKIFGMRTDVNSLALEVNTPWVEGTSSETDHTIRLSATGEVLLEGENLGALLRAYTTTTANRSVVAAWTQRAVVAGPSVYITNSPSVSNPTGAATQYITLTPSEGIAISAATLTCSVPATAQFGIYARFA